MDVWMMGPGNLKQLITEWYEVHPAFAGLEASAWYKRVMNKDPRYGTPGSSIYKFSFQYTPK